ncbi:cytochrome ubiquinol oxidase subunit I [Pantoea ananatis]|nr:cytochrome ubiquinol oxidase subunit I [Pantoea ananatis]
MSFGMGVVSGIVMSFQFGTNWAVLSERAGNILGPLLSYEVLTAFFLEASFLGVMLFGWHKVPEKLHFLATCLVAIGTLISTFWILSANSWLQTPAGYAGSRAPPGQLARGDLQSLVPVPATHMVLAAFITTCFVIGGSGWYLRRGEHRAIALSWLGTDPAWSPLRHGPLPHEPAPRMQDPGATAVGGRRRQLGGAGLLTHSKYLWGWAFALGSLCAAFWQGVILGALVEGMPLQDGKYLGGVLGWFSPFSMLTGAAVVFGYALLGGSWLILKTEGAMQRIARTLTRPLVLVVVVFMGLVSAWLPFLDSRIMARWFHDGNFWWLSPVPLLVLLNALALWRAAMAQAPACLVGSAVLLPVILGYRGKITAGLTAGLPAAAAAAKLPAPAPCGSSPARAAAPHVRRFLRDPRRAPAASACRRRRAPAPGRPSTVHPGRAAAALLAVAGHRTGGDRLHLRQHRRAPLPRNETGKLPRDRMLALLAGRED